MNVSSVSASGGNPAVSSPFAAGVQQAFAPVAQLFGDSSDQLMSELSTSGTSLSALAQQKGISQTDLIDAIKQGLQSSQSGTAPALSDTQLTNIANRIANHKHHGHHHRHAAAAPTDATGSVVGTGTVSAPPVPPQL